MTTYTTHMQIMALLMAAQVERSGIYGIDPSVIQEVANVANRVIRMSQAVAPTPPTQSRGPG